MALVICCPCGEPLECDNLELVVTVSCPKCKREVTLEFDDEHRRRCRGILTVMEGPHWVGERFVVPVGVPLKIGSELGNWIALDDEQVDKTHCEVRLTEQGNAVIEDLGSQQGTWIGGQRIARGKLGDKQSFKVGPFRLRLDYELNDGASRASQPTAAVAPGIPLPSLQNVIQKENVVHLLMTYRYHIARGMITVFAWLTGLYHCCNLYLDRHWEWYYACAMGLGMLILLADLGRRVALVHPYMNYVSVGVLVVFGIVDATMSLPFPSVASFLIAASLAVITFRIPTGGQSLAAIGLGTASAVMMGFVSYQEALRIVALYSH